MLVSSSGRPRVVLVDDDGAILKAISRFLSVEFDVAAAVTDGRSALDTVPRLDPDLVVLDISMPGLDGLQTAAELKRLGVRAKIVFLTMNEDDGFVANAMRVGAMGYVVKTLASSDLLPALRHAFAGRRYLPSLAPLAMTDTVAHALQFRGDDSSWLDDITEALIGALHRGDIIASALIESNRDAIAVRMHERGWNAADLEREGRYLVFDAEDAATRVMRDGRPDRESIARMIAALEHARASSAAGSRQLTIVGEIAATLCRRGNPEAAFEVERIWDEVTAGLPILTLCTYPIACFDDDRAHGLASAISTCHSVINHAVRIGDDWAGFAAS
jgi:DNA-binding NarL/FixJ family response regulator